MSKDTGGPAFPKLSDDGYPSGSGMGIGYLGMTLRDYFAAKAMVALHCSDERGGRWSDGSAELCARNAYIMADAMIAERNK